LETKLHIGILFLLMLAQAATAQVVPDSLERQDSVPVAPDSIAPARTYTISGDSLDAPVDYLARDSMVYDVVNRRLHLYGNAQVTYTTIKLNAAYIVFDWETNTVTAEGLADSTGQIEGRPQFSEGEQKFNAERLRYNFKTRKGFINHASSQQNDVYVLGEQAKFVGRNLTNDSTRADNIVYSKNAIFTSCDLPEPHYGIRSTKQKVIPDKTVIIGPSNLEIAGIPTPLALPFGFFPITKTARSGVIIPRDYEYDPRYGFGLSNMGYFTPIGEHFDLQVTGDLYFKQRWGLHLASRYKKRYKYNGNFAVDFGSVPEEIEGRILSQKSYSLTWTHSQEATAHPSINFGGRIHLQTGNYQRTFQNDFRSVIDNTLGSNMSFRFNPPGRPWNFAASFDHSQNTQTRRLKITFPTLDFQTQRIFPFRKKVSGADPRWYEKIGINYRASARNRLETVDTLLFSGNILDKLQYGVQQSADADVAFNFLKFFRISPNVRYAETWYFQLLKKEFDPTTTIIPIDTVVNPLDTNDKTIVYDTLYGAQTLDTLSGFKPYRQFSTGVNLNFDVFGTILLKKGWLRGVRHYMKPSFSFNYAPDQRDPRFGYVDYVDTDNRPDFNRQEEYSVFLNNSVFGQPGISSQQMAIGYSIANVLQAKVFSRKDSTVRYFNLLDDVSFNGSYNFAADSFQWSQVNFRLRANLIKNILALNFTATFDPYTSDQSGRRQNVLAWDKYRRPVEFVRAQLPFFNSITVGQLRKLFSRKGDETADVPAGADEEDRPATNDNFWSLFDNFSLSHNITFELLRLRDKDTLRITTNGLQVRGSVQLTKNWKITVENISYDFNARRLVYPSFQFYRDLHCWELGFGWQPERGTYQFFLRVKPGTLGFIEVPYQRRNLGNFGGF
jgi:hypothetical protein